MPEYQISYARNGFYAPRLELVPGWLARIPIVEIFPDHSVVYVTVNDGMLKAHKVQDLTRGFPNKTLAPCLDSQLAWMAVRLNCPEDELKELRRLEGEYRQGKL